MPRRFAFLRESYIPAGATKITDKASDAIAFLYINSKGRPAVLAFHSRAAKPNWHHSFSDRVIGEQTVTVHFEGRQRVTAYQAERARPHSFEAGQILRASWSYEQTNIDFYQVTKVVGPHTVEVRAVAQIEVNTGNEPWAAGKAAALTVGVSMISRALSRSRFEPSQPSLRADRSLHRRA